ncbi:PAS domain S-box protein [uncultured Desulfobacter sp.]|uniref:PAS domain S-box protein n=1 Tax=uncultured Desulfobacter sp. TaxID=240139 RepID=UPI002AAA6E59|nr:PAS domain S-box protein [uncultured Desulfobacter sp.]
MSNPTIEKSGKHLLFKFSNTRIRTKLLAMIAMIVTVFLMIVLTVVASFHRIETVLGDVISHDMNNVMTNALTERELSSIVADLNLLLNTFFESDGDRLLASTRVLTRGVKGSELERPLGLFVRQVEFLLEQCREVNTALRRVSDADVQILSDLDRLDEIIADNMINATLIGDDVSILQQLSVLIVGYRQSLLEIGKLHAQRWPKTYYAPFDMEGDPMIGAIDELDFRLRTLIAGDSHISDFGRAVIRELQAYKDRLLALNTVMVELKRRMLDVEATKHQATEILKKLDRDVVHAVKTANAKVMRTFRITEIFLIVVCLVLIAALTMLTSVFFRRMIKKPMYDICDGISALRRGNLEARIDLGRRDEWYLIQDALNSMAAALSSSYADLKEAQSFVSNIIDSMPSVLVGVDENGAVTQWNLRAEQMTGISSEKARFQYLGTVFPDLADEMDRIKSSIREQRILKNANVLRKDRKAACYEDVTIYPLVADGVTGAVIRIDDVTERMLAQAKLTQSEKQYRLLIEHAVSGIAVFEIVFDQLGQPVDYVFLSVNPAFEIHTGLKTADVLGRGAYSVLPGTEKTGLYKMFDQVAFSGEPASLDRFFKPLGRYFMAAVYKVDENHIATVFTDVSKQKLMELALKQERDLFRAGPVFILSTQPQDFGKLIFVSENVHKILGFTPEEMTADSFRFSELIHPGERSRVVEEAIGYIESDAVNYELNFRLRNRSGEYRWFYDHTQLVRDETGKIIRLNSYLFDQTDQKQMEEALRISEQKARAILDTSFQLFGMLDLDGTLIDLNQTVLDLNGLPKSEVLGKPLWEAPSWSYSIELQDRLRAAVKTAAAGKSVQFEVTHPTPDGNLEYVEFSLRPVKDDDGKVLFLIPEGHFITARKKAENRLTDEQRRLSTIIDGTNVGTWEWNVQTGQTVFNDIWARIVGYTLEELAPVSIETWNRLAHPEDLQRSREQLKKHFNGELSYYEIECRMKHKDGRWIWVYDRGRVMTRDADGAPLLMFGTHQDITERKRQKKKLKESELRFHAVIDASPVPIILENDSGKIIYTNPAFTDTFGYALDDIPHIDDWWSAAYPDPAYREEIKSIVLQRLALAEEKKQTVLPAMEVRICCKDRSFRTVSVSRAILGGTAQKIRLGILFDVTLIRRISERLQTILANTSDGMHVLDEQGNLVEFSNSFSHMLGYTMEETAQLNLTDWDKFTPIQSISHRIEKSMTGPTTLETRYLRKNGEMFDVEINAKGIVLDGQRLLYASSRDISARKRAENQLKQALLEQSAVLENANVGITHVKDRIQVKSNKKMAEIFGYELEEMVNKRTRIFYPSQKEFEEVGQESGPVLWSGNIYTTQRQMSRKDGSLVWVRISGTAIDINEPESGSIWVFEDISEAKAREQELQEAKAEAEQASKLKSEFLANMSHEIRTPMNGVIGMADLLIDTHLSTEQWHYANAIRSSGELLLGLINDILDFSKIEAGKLEMETIEFDLFSLLDDFMDSMAARAHDKNLELLCSVDPGTPSRLQGDPGRLRQVLNNLTGNAIKFTETGEVVIKVSVIEEDPDECLVRFAVMDTGIGIPADKLSLLFDKFSQVDASTTRRYGGTGLGLAISKQLAELMNGEIGVSSREGHGSEFWFTSRFKKFKGAQSLRPPVPVDLQGIRVLIVDDNATNREILTTQLSAWGMRPHESSNGPQALVELKKAADVNDPYKIAVIDMQMPDMDGKTLGRAIKKDPSLAPMRMIMLTSLGRRGDARLFEAAGFDAYANKPIRHRDFLSIITRVMSGESAAGSHTLVTRYSTREEMRPFGTDLHVLVVEDNDINRQVAVGALMKIGVRADAAADGVEAINALKSIPYDLVLMDIQMPGMDGYQATRRIRDPETGVLDSNIPIIAMTAYAMQGDREKCLSNGMNDYISKPIDRDALVKVLKNRLPAFAVPPSAAGPKSWSPGDDFPALAGIAVQEALNALDMDFQSYKGYLLAFCKDAESALGELPALVRRNIPADISALAHKLAGAAGNLRAFQIKAAAVALEQATLQGQIPGALVNELEKALQTLIDCVKPLAETGQTDETGKIELLSAYTYLDRIETLIASSDFVPQDLVAGLARALGGRLDHIVLNRLKNSLLNFDYQGADDAAKAIRAGMDTQSSKETGA